MDPARHIKMPTEREMAEAYIAQVENQLKQLKDNVVTLENHLEDCRKELKEKSKEKENKEK